MKRINLLDIETSNKIAAGEVVERPSSVVKELIENSIDAHATKITVEIENGGETLIKIIDNGLGIHPDDVERAFLPHATSKIKDIEDVFSINTLGFRGEALASIASVSRTKLFSRTEEFEFGREIYIEGGTINYIKDTGCNVGTIIEVRDLFFNVPARKKFMKSSSRESALINEIVSKISLANADISITLINNGKRTLTTYGNSNVLDVVRAIYGKNISENLTYFEGLTDILSVHGYIGNSEIARGSRNYQSIFVNNRFIKNRLIATAVENAFKSFITVNKFPFFILFIDIFPDFVDVNIHPTKAEIKFRDDRLIFKVVFDSVHKALRKSLEDNFSLDEEHTSENNNSEKVEPIDYFHQIDNSMKVKENDKPLDGVNIPVDLNPHNKEGLTYKDILNDKDTNNDLYNATSQVKTNTYVKPLSENIEHTTEEINQSDSKENVNVEESIKPKFPYFRIIGQFNKTYILSEYNEALYLIDQHAAHEKILFEQYKNEIKNSKVVCQPLLVPLLLELSLDDFGIYEENKEIFLKSGFNIEEFGDTSITIREVPYVLGKLDLKNFFMDMIDNIKNLGSGKKEDIKFNKIASMACRAAIKANDSLTLDEMEHLLEKLRYIDEPFTCPHGRPTIIKMDLYEIEKRFKRIQ